MKKNGINLPKKLILVLSFLLTSVSYGSENGKFNIIVDTDMAVDDWPAVMYVLNQRERANILGFTVPGNGESHCNKGVQNLLDLIHLVGRSGEGLDVTCGDTVPMEGVHTFPAQWRDEVDSFFGLKIPRSPQKATNKTHSVEHLKKMLIKSNDVVVLTLGPLTNFGRLFKKYPEVKKKIRRIYIMGGSVHAGGNIAKPHYPNKLKNKYAEFNIWADPLAAKIVFRSGVPITMVGLDATNQVQVTRKFAKKFKKMASSKGAKFTDTILDKNGGFIDSGEYFFWDPLTAVAVFEDICKIKTLKIDVNAEEQKGTTAKEQLQGFIETFALEMGRKQFAGKLLGRKALNELESGRTFVSKKVGVKKVEVCMGIKSKENFMGNYMKILNKF